MVTERPAKGSGVSPALASAGGQRLGVKRASVRQQWQGPVSLSHTVAASALRPGSAWKAPGLQKGATASASLPLPSVSLDSHVQPAGALVDCTYRAPCAATLCLVKGPPHVDYRG